MKKLIVAIVIGLVPFLSTGQAFDKYENMKDVDAMIITSKMFKMLAKVDLSDSDPEAQAYIKLIENLDQIKTFASRDEKVRAQMAADVKNYLQKGSLDQLMKVSEGNKSIKFYSRPGKNDNYVSELFMFMEGDKDGDPISVILTITGQIDLNQLSRLASDLKVPGAEELKNVENKS